MATYNRVMLIGNVTKDVETKQTSGGKSISIFDLAVNSAKKEDTMFIKVVVWEKLSDIVSKYVKKGSSLFVEGKIVQTHWDKNGEKRYSYQVEANNVQFIGEKKQSSSQQEDTHEEEPEDNPLIPY